MSLAQFFQIIAAGRWRILLCVLACLGGALWFAAELPSSYEARARVLLQLASPDLVTGVEVSADATETYVRTQQLLAMSDRVAMRVVDKLGWTENPAVIAAWNGATGGVGDIRSWAAQSIMRETAAVPLEGGGTMEIVYRAPDVDAATMIAGLLRESYVETALALQTESAARRAERYDELTRAARVRLATAEQDYTALQRKSGMVADAYGNDIESGAMQRLQTNAIGASAAVAQGGAPRRSLATDQLRQSLITLEQQISIVGGSLGLSNPEVQQLLARRDAARRALAGAMAADTPKGAAAGRRLANEANAAYREERARVLARGPDALVLMQALRRVTLLRAELRRVMNNGASLRMQAERTESGLVIMGDVVGNRDRVSPNLPLTATLAILFGLGLGVVYVAIDGLLRREVRGSADLASATGVPVLGVLPPTPRGSRWQRWTSWLRSRMRPAQSIALGSAAE